MKTKTIMEKMKKKEEVDQEAERAQKKISNLVKVEYICTCFTLFPVFIIFRKDTRSSSITGVVSGLTQRLVTGTHQVVHG